MKIRSTQGCTAGRREHIGKERNDQELIRSIAKGDKLALQALFVRYNVRVYRFVLRFTRDECVAEDTVSEVFLDIWRSAGKFRGQCLVATWLVAMARNKAIDACRKHRFSALDDAQSEAIEDPADNPELTLEKKHRGALLQKSLKALSPVHEQIIDLVYFQSRSIQEAAIIVGVPPSTVKTRMFYARRQLAHLLCANGITTALA